MRGLTPEKDLMFVANSKVRIGDERSAIHLRKRGGINIFEGIGKPFSDAGMHICGCADKIKQKIDLMEEAILNEDWIKFDNLHYELMELKPSKKTINAFGRKQMKSLISRNPTIREIETLWKKLGGKGVSKEALNLGYNEGYALLKKIKRH